MEDLSLNTLYPEPPKPIDLSNEPKSKVKVEESFMKLTDMLRVFFSQGFWSFTISATGLVTLGFLGLMFWHPFDASDSLASASNQEKHVLSRVQRYCFNPIPWLNDEPTCQGWLKQYRELDKYEGEIAITESELTANARAEFEKKQKRKKMEREAAEQAGLFLQTAGAATVGNEQSPTLH